MRRTVNSAYSQIVSSIVKRGSPAARSSCFSGLLSTSAASPLGARPTRQLFPVRNRIISDLALGTLVVEAGERSGAPITVRFALEQGRDVFAVPWSIFSPKSAGPNLLIRDGAGLVSCGQDILDALNLSTAIE